MVKQNAMTNDELLHKWVNKSITVEELQIFKLRPEYDSLVELYSYTDNLVGPELDGQTMLKEILASPKANSNQKAQDEFLETKTRSLSWLKYGIAATILCLAGWWLMPQQDMIQYDIAAAKELKKLLPDGSEFVLAGGSKLSYNKSEWSEVRKINLDGQAFFSVNKGKPFIVETSLGEVKVLGTEFKVVTSNNKLIVSCKEGSVQVSSVVSDNYLETLEAGEFMELELSGTSKTFKNNITKLRKIVLEDLKDALSTKYEVEFLPSGIISNEKFSCNYQHVDLNLALKTALSPLSIDYKIIDDETIQLIK